MQKSYLYFSLFNFPFVINNDISIFLYDPFKIFWSKNPIDSFSQNNIVRRNIEVDSIFNSLKQIDLDVNIAGASHTRNYTFFFRQARGKMNVISCHSLQSASFNQIPKFEVRPMNDNGVESWVLNFDQQGLSFHLLHWMSLSSSNIFMMSFFHQLKSFLVVVFNNPLNYLLIDLVPLILEIFDNVIKFDKSCIVNC